MQPGELSATHEPAERPRRGQSRGPATRPVSSSASDARHMPARPASCRSFGKVFLCVRFGFEISGAVGDIATCHSSVGGEFSQCFASLTGSTPPRREWPPCIDRWIKSRLLHLMLKRAVSYLGATVYGQQSMGMTALTRSAKDLLCLPRRGIPPRMAGSHRQAPKPEPARQCVDAALGQVHMKPRLADVSRTVHLCHA
jgi:hypothetical protein